MRRLVTCFLAAAMLCAGCTPTAREATVSSPPPQTQSMRNLASTVTAPDPSAPVSVQERRTENAPADARPAEGSAPAPAQPPSTLADVSLARLPLWGRPGLHLAKADAGAGPAYAYAPVEMLGTTLQPVRLRQGTAYFRVEGDAVYLHGVETPRGGFSALPEPQLVHRLPVRAGDTWTIHFPGLMGDRFTYTVEAIEPVETPTGEQPAVRVAVAAEDGSGAVEWWVPGYGLVSYADAYVSWRAERELNREPEWPAAVGRPAPGWQALLWDDGNQYWITTSDGKQELFRVADSYWRSYYGWAQAGEYDLLTHYLYPGSWGVGRFSAFRYSEQAGQFQQLNWISSAGTTPQVVGDGGWGTTGTFTLWDFTGYPTRVYVYRFDGEAMRSDPGEERMVRARSPEAFVRRFFNPPPLNEADARAMFRDPGLYEEARQIIRELGIPVTVGVGAIAPVDGNPNAFIVGDGDQLVLVEVEMGEADFLFTRFELLAGGE